MLPLYPGGASDYQSSREGQRVSRVEVESWGSVNSSVKLPQSVIHLRIIIKLMPIQIIHCGSAMQPVALGHGSFSGLSLD